MDRPSVIPTGVGSDALRHGRSPGVRVGNRRLRRPAISKGLWRASDVIMTSLSASTCRVIRPYETRRTPASTAANSSTVSAAVATRHSVPRSL
jgi:hypothetical protein